MKVNKQLKNSLGLRFSNELSNSIDFNLNFKLIDKYNKEYNLDKNLINATKTILKEGKIVAIKDFSGFNLICDGTNHKSISNLRKNKNTKTKPLALMMKDINEVKKYCYVSEQEKTILNRKKNSILILKKKNNKLPNNISFNNDSLGIMLPPTSIYDMLFDDELKILVSTSGNLNNCPIIYKNEEALDKLKDVADYFLIYEDEIFVPQEPSITKVILDEERVMKTSTTITSPINHHHAHIVSCMFENNINEKVIGLSFDGVGYGEDENLGGSEFLICDNKSFKRAGHLKNMKMPGSLNAIMEPWKMAVSLLDSWSSNKLSIDVEEVIKSLNMNNLFSYIKHKNYHTIIYMIKNDINTPLTSSMGRLFDGISALLNFQNKISYEGEAIKELENLAKKSDNIKDYYKFEINYENNQFIIDTDYIVESVFGDIVNNINPCDIAMKFHNTIVEFSFRICLYLRELYNLNIVALSGEIFENEIIFTKLYKKLNSNEFEVLTHKILPCNDSNLYVGQLIIDINKRQQKMK